MERVMKLTKDFNNMQNYIQKLDFAETISSGVPQPQNALIVDGINHMKRNSTSKASQYASGNSGGHH